MTSKFQLLFDNTYLSGRGRRTGSRSRSPGALHRMSPLLMSSSIAALFVGALLVIPFGAAEHSARPLTTTGAPAWSSYDTGRLEVVFSSPLPTVELLQDVNGSAAATLSLEHVYEIAPGGGTHPMLERTASPGSLAGFNSSSASQTTAWPLSMEANVPVVATSTVLWGVPPAGPENSSAQVAGNTAVSVNFSLSRETTAAQGVTFQWQVSNWPWVSPVDLLAVEFRLDVLGGGSVQTCAPPQQAVSLTDCAGTSLSIGSIVWDPSVGALLARTPGGPLAAVSWVQNVTTTTGEDAAVEFGAFAPRSGLTDIVLAAPAGGSANATGATSFYLAAPFPTVAPGLLAPEPPVYAGAALVFAGLIAAAWVGSRRRSQKMSDAL
jgi:hypothetical protein